MNSLVKIAVLDSGINKSHSRLSAVHFYKTKSFVDDGEFCVSDGHGTNVCDRIRLSISKGASLDNFLFYDLQIFKDKANICEKAIIDALRYCIDEHIDIINLSIGITSLMSPPEELYNICNEAVNKNIIIVAAADNFGNTCFPADFKFVFGVSAGVIDKWDIYGYNKLSGHFIGKGDLQRMADLGSTCVFKAGTSYATGHISGLISLFIEKNKNQALTPLKIMDILISQSVKGVRVINSETSQKILMRFNIISKKETDNILDFYFSKKRFSWIKNTAIYPFSNKEFGCIRHFYDQFKPSIVELMDFPRSLLKDKNVVLGNLEYELKISVASITNKIDSFIIGYPDDIASSVNVKYYEELLEYASLNNKNIFCFDAKVYFEIKEQFRNKEERKLYCPIVRNKDGSYLKSLVSLGKIKKPVLAVVGTSSRCGKFSLQLKLKRLLQNIGYSVGWLSTEPQGELFGSDYSFPCGFAPSIGVPLNDWSGCLRGIIKGIEISHNPDIILTGLQSGLISYSRTTDMFSTMNNLAFLSGVQPDAAICVVSRNDSCNYIERVIKTMDYFYQIPIIYLVLSEIEYESKRDDKGNIVIKQTLLTKEEWMKHADILIQKFKLPVLNTYDDSCDADLANLVVSFFN